jgi:anti-anti-sigma regulatory factor
MSLRVTTSKVEPDIVVLHLAGIMPRSPETDAFESLLRELLNRNDTKLVFDLAGIVEIDADAALFLVRCFFTVRGAGGELRFAAARPDVVRPFKRKMLDTLLPFDPTVAAACERLKGGAKIGGSPA